MTIYFAVAADLNAGVITTIWSVTPFFMATADYFVYGVKLRAYHIIGISLIVLSTILLSLMKIIDPDFTEEAISAIPVGKNVVPIIVPVLFGLLTPVFFTIYGVYFKHLISERVGFVPYNLMFGTVIFVCTILLLIVIPYWADGHFDQRLFWIGFFGSIMDTLGKVSGTTALKYGPAGPCGALQCLSGMYLVVVQAIINQKMIRLIEFIALIICLVGSLILVIPNQLKRCSKRLVCMNEEEDNRTSQMKRI